MSSGGSLSYNVVDFYPRGDTVLGVVPVFNLVTPAVYNAVQLGPRPALLKFILFENFSTVLLGNLLGPTTIGWGTDAARTNMANNGFNGTACPFVFQQPLATPYIPPGIMFGMSLSSGTAGQGTCQVTFVGSLL